MNIEKNGELSKVIAEKGYRLTNRQRTIFVESLYLAKNDSPDNYEEVGKDIWGAFVKDTDADIRIADMSKEVSMLKDFILDNDYRILLVEESTRRGSLSESSYCITNKLMLFSLLQSRILSNTYNSKPDMETMLADYYRNKKILKPQFNELFTLLN